MVQETLKLVKPTPSYAIFSMIVRAQLKSNRLLSAQQPRDITTQDLSPFPKLKMTNQIAE